MQVNIYCNQLIMYKNWQLDMFTQNQWVLRNQDAQSDWDSKQFPLWQTYYTCIRNLDTIKKQSNQVLLIDIKNFFVLKFLYVN